MPFLMVLVLAQESPCDLSFVAPLIRASDTVSCADATASASGCVSATDQAFGGNKVGTGLWQFTNAFSRNLGPETVSVSQINYYGLMLGDGPVTSTLDDQVLTLEARRPNDSIGPGVVITNSFFRDAGSFISVKQGLPCRTELFSFGHDGTLTIAPSTDPACNDSVDILSKAGIRAGTPASGYVLMEAAPEAYLHIRGRLAEDHNAIFVAGGRPSPDGGYEVRCPADGGGCYFAYSGSHASFTVTTPEPQYGAGLFQLGNDNGIGGETKFVVATEGGFTNSHGLTASTLPKCPGETFYIRRNGQVSQFSRGVSPGTLQYADDTEHYYVCKADGWKKLRDEGDP